jgi:hypothetical protein
LRLRERRHALETLRGPLLPERRDRGAQTAARVDHYPAAPPLAVLMAGSRRERATVIVPAVQRLATLGDIDDTGLRAAAFIDLHPGRSGALRDTETQSGRRPVTPRSERPEQHRPATLLFRRELQPP